MGVSAHIHNTRLPVLYMHSLIAPVKQSETTPSLKVNYSSQNLRMATQNSAALLILKKQIDAREEWAQDKIRVVACLSDHYRPCAVAYHLTSLEARTSNRIDAASRHRLEKAFTDFNEWFQPFAKVEDALQEMLGHCRSGGTLEVLLERNITTAKLKAEISRQINFGEKGDALSQWYDPLHHDMKMLLAEHALVYEGMDFTPWYVCDDEADKERGFWTPARPSAEWDMFKQ